VARNLIFRTLMIGVVCTASLMLWASSSAAQKRSRQDEDVISGQLIFNNACRTCHTMNEGDNRLGPNLYKIVGRKLASRSKSKGQGRSGQDAKS
jgi:cytochrome c